MADPPHSGGIAPVADDPVREGVRDKMPRAEAWIQHNADAITTVLTGQGRKRVSSSPLEGQPASTLSKPVRPHETGLA